jgi:putative oxidoreductase
MPDNNSVTKLLTGSNDKLLVLGLLLLRCTVGVILFAHGAGKVFGWFGGNGFEQTVQAFSERGYAHLFIYLSIFTEFIGGILLTIGFLTRPVAVAVTINMLVATIALLPNGFLLGRAAYPFSLMMITIVILLTGPMMYSIDYLIARPGSH